MVLNLRQPRGRGGDEGSPEAQDDKRTLPPTNERIVTLITEKYKNYADYQTKTKREIPLVLPIAADRG
jgi:hypothetical protein